ncbi:MAG TPA: GNAT family N-acetyltransferase [Kofleriaceae bacterium]|jgi:putative acetyltransferase
MRFAPGDLGDPRVVELLTIHVTHARASSPPGTSFALDLTGLRAPGVQLWTSWDGDLLVATGALKQLAPDHAEVKSMHVAAAARGRGAGSAMLRHLLDLARAAGATRVSLETGTSPYFATAAAMYRKHGFTACGPFGDYSPSEDNLFLSRAL